MGWNLGVRSPWRNAIGLRNANAAGAFERFSPGPILDRSPEDPYTLSYHACFNSARRIGGCGTGQTWRLAAGNDDMRHAIKLARSRDGIHWTRDGTTVVGFAAEASTRGASERSESWRNAADVLCLSRRNYRLGLHQVAMV